MSSQSSNVSSHYEDDQDVLSSCETYSSGWDRSSISEYFDSTCTEEITDDDFCAMGEFYLPPKSTGASKIFDLEYKCDLVVLPHPYKKKSTTLFKKEPLPISTTILPETTTILNPWKKIEKNDKPDEDPWKFLETQKQVPLPLPQSPPPKVVEKRKQFIDNSNTNKLCKYKGDCRMNKHNNCNRVHSLAEWKPRICRFNNGCRRKISCGYYHTETSLKEYLRTMIKIKDSIYAKDSTLYEKYL